MNVNACACLSSLLSQLNYNSLHKACLSHMTLNIHRPVSFNNPNVCSQIQGGRGLWFTEDLRTEDECGF